MKNVILTKAKQGWFLTIGDDLITNRWAVTSEELWCVHKVIEDNMQKIHEELNDIDDVKSE